MEFDVVIVGGGLAGLSLAVALRNSGLSIAVVEGREPVLPAGWDARIYAVSPANVAFLETLGIWPQLDAQRIAPVRQMEIRGDAGGRLDFSAYNAGVAALAWIVESAPLQRQLWRIAGGLPGLSLICPARPAALAFDADAARLTLADGRTLAARLVVGADGADSWTRTAAGIDVVFKAYRQHGVVANFECSAPHRDTAFQWFRDDGVLAYLPLPGNRISIVWSTDDDNALRLMQLAPREFAAEVAAAGAQRLGTLTPLGAAAAFPLRLMRPPRIVAPRLALIGDAAHAIHPLSGHGINLGFQDARVLAATLADRPAHADCGDERRLRRYQRTRKEEVVALQSVTDGLHRLFAAPSLPFSVLRNLGLNLTNRLPVVRDALVRYAMG